MKKSEPRSKNVIHREVSVTETLVRTASLVALTLVFAAAFRFWQPAIRLAQHVAGTSFWQSLYGLFHIESGLGREQLILSGIIVVCFLLALLVQIVGLIVFRKIRDRRH